MGKKDVYVVPIKDGEWGVRRDPMPIDFQVNFLQKQMQKTMEEN